MTEKPKLSIKLAKPRGFCAGVDRAVLIVERALEIYGAPVYVRHEIVHNKRVVDRLRGKGWVQSTPSKTDLRRLEISLTEQGRAFAKGAVKRAQLISQQTTKKLSAREAERLLALLGKL